MEKKNVFIHQKYSFSKGKIILKYISITLHKGVQGGGERSFLTLQKETKLSSLESNLQPNTFFPQRNTYSRAAGCPQSESSRSRHTFMLQKSRQRL